MKLEFVEETDSTNSELLRRLSSLNKNEFFSLHKTVLIAERQTKGKGRSGRFFYSPKESGLYFSFIHAPPSGIENPAELTVNASIAVSRAIERVFLNQKKSAKIKWVNDVLIDEKKVCGILTEGFMGQGSEKIDAAVVGIGINLFVSDDLPQELKNIAGGILSQKEMDFWKKENPEKDPRKLLLETVLKEFFTITENKENIIEEYRSRSCLTGKTVHVSPLIGNEENSYNAKVLGITDDAKLIVQLENGSTRELNSGEVTLHR